MQDCVVGKLPEGEGAGQFYLLKIGTTSLYWFLSFYLALTLVSANEKCAIKLGVLHNNKR